MIKNQDIAKEISELMLSYGAKLDASVAVVIDKCSKEEAIVYKKAVGKIMGAMLLEIMNPLYKQHPELKPKELI
jgi:phenylpyruvate tautomerase PptA (4-oxalocrotonate tautomerase family)